MAKHIPLSRANREAERVIEAFGGGRWPMPLRG